MRPVYLAGLICTGLLLASCADQPERTSSDTSWQDRETQLKALSHWKASGKLALRTQDKSESASLMWEQSDNVTHIVLSGPLGLSATSIESDQSSLTIEQGGQIRHYDISARTAHTAWDLPVQALPYWILGLPAPGEPVQEQLIEQNSLRQMTQLGWTVTYEDYGQFDQYILPTRMKVERNSTRARLLIRQWSDFSRR